MYSICTHTKRCHFQRFYLLLMLLMLLVCHTTDDVSYKTDDSTLTSLFSLSFFFFFFEKLPSFLALESSSLLSRQSPLAPLALLLLRRRIRERERETERERELERRYLFTAQRVPLLARFIKRTKERSQNTYTHLSLSFV
jgi:hypothetical protein